VAVLPEKRRTCWDTSNHARETRDTAETANLKTDAAQYGQPLPLAKEHRFFHLVPVGRCRCTGRHGDITRGQRAPSGIPAYDRSAQHAWRYLDHRPIKVIY
jgi:hypothetical protein